MTSGLIEPGVRYVQHGDEYRIPERRAQVVDELCRVLDVPACEVDVQMGPSSTDGFLRVAASWTPAPAPVT